MDIGYRVSGTVKNDVLTVDYLKAQVEDIIRNKHPDVEIEYKHQKLTGSFERVAKFYGMINNYIGVQNIVVKLQPKNVDPDLNYVLLNSHFDTVPLSSGAGKLN